MSSLTGTSRLLRSLTTLNVRRVRRKYVDASSVEDGIAQIRVHDDEGGNAINVQLLEELDYVLADLAEKWNLRTVLIKSALSGIFSKGLDLGAYAQWSDEEVMYVALRTRETLQRLSAFPIPTVACVDGVAVGAGAELALGCDFRCGSRQAVFSFPETRLALIPYSIAADKLPKLVGYSRAKELLLTGRRVDAGEASEMGLLDFLVDEDLGEKALSLARQMQSGAPLALRAAKKALDEGGNGSVVDLMRILVSREDRREGVKALLENRKPNYKGQ